MKKIRFFFLLFIITFLSFFKTNGIASSIIKEKFPLTIKNPSLSHEQRLKLKLPNHLEVLLISNYKTTISGAALVVNSGSWDNPKDHLGLAHLVEHSVFLGSQKYPGIADFSNHLTKYNGTYNAFTSDKTTTYLFTINNEGFLEALDQMSSFLIAPLFRENDINKEKNAINEEFSRNKFNDQWRMFRLKQLISNPNHPAHLFSTGNLASLEHSSPQDMQKWFQNHYFAKNMKLIIFSSLPINVLVEKVENYFINIPEKPIASLSSPPSIPIFDDISKNQIFITQPLIDKSVINLIWILPEEYFKNLSAIKQISFLLEHGNKNGLIDNLKKELLISNLTTEIYSHKKNVEFSIEIELTEKGNNEYLKVLEQCFTYFNYLQNKNIPEYIFDDINIINSLDYEFQDHQDLFSYLNELSKQISEENLSKYPSRQYLLKTNDLTDNKNLLDYLANPENCRFIFLTSSFQNNTNKNSIYYDPIYELKAFALPLTVNNNSKINIELPKKNPFLNNIKENFYNNILEKQQTSYPFQPKQFNITSFSSLYYTVNDYIPGPKTAWDLLISFPKKFPINKNFVLTDLFVTLTKDALKDLTSYAKTANIESCLNSSINGIKLSISGFCNNTVDFFNVFMSRLNTYEFSEEEFKNAVHKLSHNYAANKYKSPIFQGLDLLFDYLLNGYISLDKKISIISELTWKDFQLFSIEEFKKIFIEGMFLGNLSKKELTSITTTVSNFSKKKEKYNVSNNQFLHLKKFLKKEETLEASSPFDSNVLIFSLAKDKVSSLEFVSTSLLFKSLQTAFFEDLRTKQQVGYAVGAKLKLISLQSLCGIFYIQSKKYNPKELLQKTQIFLEDFKNNLSLYGISEKSFLSLKNSFIDELTHPDESLEEICSYLFDLTFNPYNSHSKNSLNKIIEAATQLTYEKFIEIIKNFLDYQDVIISKIFINATSK